MSPALAETEGGKIEISRSSMYVGKFTSYSVYFDGIKVGNIRDGETKPFFVSPGVHSVWLRISGFRSNRVQVDVVENETIHLLLERREHSGLRYWGSLVAFGLMLTLGATLGMIFFPVFVIAAVLCIHNLWRPVLRVM
jgi:hypothetical protein